MKTFSIASPYGSNFCYDKAVFLSLKKAMTERGNLKYDAKSPNRIYLLGNLNFNFDRKETTHFNDIPWDKSFNIALVGSYYHQLQNSRIRDFDVVLASSVYGYEYITQQYNRIPDGLWYLYSPFDGDDVSRVPSYALTQDNLDIPELDVAFVGNIRPRPAMEMLMKVIDKLKVNFKYYGYAGDRYMGNPKVKSYWGGTHMPYHQFPELAKKAKIILVDMHDHMAGIGVPSFKYMDMVMSGALVMTPPNRFIKNIAKGITFSSEKDLSDKIVTYLKSPGLRDKQVKAQQKLLRPTHNMDFMCSKLEQLIIAKGK